MLGPLSYFIRIYFLISSKFISKSGGVEILNFDFGFVDLEKFDMIS